MRKRAFFLTLSVSLLLPLLLSCRAEPLAPEEPIAVLIAPSNGSTLPSGDVEVRVYLQNFKLAENNEQTTQAGQGYIIYYLDVRAPLDAGSPATTAPHSFEVSSETAYTWQNVPPGEHVFSVQLVNNDNTPLLPPVAVRANVTLKSR